MNVIDFAIRMEEEHQAYYEKLVAATPIAGLKTIFSMLAGLEQEHHGVMEALKKERKGTRTDSKVLDRVKRIFGDLLAERGALATIKTDLDAYRYALKLEADSVRFYEEMAQKEQSPAIRKLLLQIAEEEKHHFNIVENICDFVATPNTFLAWGEFSNLKEF